MVSFENRPYSYQGFFDLGHRQSRQLDNWHTSPLFFFLIHALALSYENAAVSGNTTVIERQAFANGRFPPAFLS